MDNNDMTHTDIDYVDVHSEPGKSETPVILMILVSMGLWLAVLCLVPMVVVVTGALMIALAIVQVAVAPWLASIRMARRDVRCEF